MKNDFRQAYSEIESKILADNELVGGVELIALLGSAADKEESNEWSDLDVLVVLKSDSLGNISINKLNKLQKIAADSSAKHPFPISILSHTFDDFEKYVSFEYLKHYSFGECTYPDRSYLRVKIDSILLNRGVGECARKAYCAYHMRHIRFNLLRKYVSLNRANSSNSTKEFGKLLIDKMIKTTDLMLNYKDLWPKTKSEILSLAEKEVEIGIEPLTSALRIRSGWNEVSDSELGDFIPVGLRYISDVVSLLLGDYQESTPEERMSK